MISDEAHTVLGDGRDSAGKAGQTQLTEAGEGRINYNNGLEPAIAVQMFTERIE